MKPFNIMLNDSFNFSRLFHATNMICTKQQQIQQRIINFVNDGEVLILAIITSAATIINIYLRIIIIIWEKLCLFVPRILVRFKNILKVIVIINAESPKRIYCSNTLCLQTAMIYLLMLLFSLNERN